MVKFGCDINGWPGAARKPTGFLAKPDALTANSSGGCPMTAMSNSAAARPLTISSRLPTCSLILTRGFSLTKVTSSRGS
jgi:hypothetical protein